MSLEAELARVRAERDDYAERCGDAEGALDAMEIRARAAEAELARVAAEKVAEIVAALNYAGHDWSGEHPADFVERKFGPGAGDDANEC